MDEPAACEAWPAFAAARRAQGLPTVAISAVNGEGLDELKAKLASLLPDAAELSKPPRSEGVVVHHIESVGDSFRVDLEDGVFVVRGRKIERLASQTNFEVEESAERFQRELARLGVDEELRRQGVVPGKTVRIGASELEWEPDDWDDR
jgi:GTP-binding protein